MGAKARRVAVALLACVFASACASYQGPVKVDRWICMTVGAAAGGTTGGVLSNNNRNKHNNINWTIAAGAAGGALLGYLLCGEEPAMPPTVSGSADPNRGTAPLTTRLRAVGKSDGGEIASYSWDFGDGSSGTGREVTHTYREPGNYRAKLTVTDNRGLEASTNVAVLAEKPAAKPAPPPAPKRRIVLRGVNFAFDSAMLTPDAQVTLEAAIEALRESPGTRITVAGYTDSVGAEDYNQSLSQRRAQAVADYLEKGGIDASKLSVRGFGESDPVASNETADGRAQNRRVSLDVMQ